MGHAKNMRIRDFERGFSDHIEKNVCSAHFNDSGLEEFIQNNSEEGKCSYCDEEEISESVVSIPVLVEYILDCLKLEYGNPNDEGLPYESREGGYQLSEVSDTEDLIDSEIGIDDEQLKNDIIESIENNEWCEVDPFALREGEELLYTWRNFCTILKHKARFVFFKTTFAEPESYMEPFDILDKIGEIVYELKLYYNTTHDFGFFPMEEFYRARQHKVGEAVNSVYTLGSPPKEKAVVNRMSPAGISMFYCADYKNTAISEVLDKSDTDKPMISVGCFKLIRPLNIISLKNLKGVSLFDEKKNKYYQAMRFLWNFKDEITKPVSRDGAEHIDYVPTQVVTEYFRYVFSEKYKIKIDGIEYPSVKNPGKSSFVLFFEQEHLADDSKKSRAIKEIALVLDKKTIETIRW